MDGQLTGRSMCLDGANRGRDNGFLTPAHLPPPPPHPSPPIHLSKNHSSPFKPPKSSAAKEFPHNSHFISHQSRMLGIDEFEIYRDNSTNSLHSDYIYNFSLPFERVHDKIGWTLFFQRHWHHSITVSILYYGFIRIVQFLMRNRPPFQLQRPLLFWNMGLALFSLVGLFRFSEDFLYNWASHGLPFALCHSCNPDSVAAFWSLLFAISKFVELGDTLFIVLRKRPLIFLHYYHHAAVLIYTIHSGTEHTAPGQAFISMNFLAHSAMYSYYAAKSANFEIPKWLSMTVTSIQTGQMFLGVAVSLFVMKLKILDGQRCQQSWANLSLAFAIYISFALLFVQFFSRTYLRPNQKAKTN